MKTKSPTLFSAGIAAALVAPAMALEAPADNSPPPAAVNTAPADASVIKPLRFDPPGAEKPLPDAPATAFLGIVTSDVNDDLAEHLDLKAGEGIIVRSLMPDGPAAKAGIAVHDVITRLADQVITSPADISKCVAAQKPGDKVTLEIIHKGKPAKIDVTLGNRPAGTIAAAPQPSDLLNLEEFPKDLADRIRGAIQGNIGALDLGAVDDPAAPVPPAMGNALREMKKQMEKALGAPQVMNAGGIHLQAGTLRIQDPQGSVEVKANNGSKEVTIRDSSEKIVWSGPWDTEQDKAAAPGDIRKRLDNLHLDGDANGNGIQLRLNAPAAPDADGP